MQPLRSFALAATLVASVLAGCVTDADDSGDTSDSRVTRIGNGKADEPARPIQSGHNYQVEITGFDLADLPAASDRPLRLNLGGAQTDCNTYGGVLTCEGQEFTGRYLRDGVDVEFDVPTREVSGVERVARAIVGGARFGETGEYEIEVDVDWDGLKVEGVTVKLTVTF